MSEKAPFMVFSGTNSRYLAEKICASLNCPLGNMNITHFADGEFAVSYKESIRRTSLVGTISVHEKKEVNNTIPIIYKGKRELIFDY